MRNALAARRGPDSPPGHTGGWQKGVDPGCPTCPPESTPARRGFPQKLGSTRENSPMPLPSVGADVRSPANVAPPSARNPPPPSKRGYLFFLEDGKTCGTDRTGRQFRPLRSFGAIAEGRSRSATSSSRTRQADHCDATGGIFRARSRRPKSSCTAPNVSAIGELGKRREGPIVDGGKGVAVRRGGCGDPHFAATRPVKNPDGQPFVASSSARRLFTGDNALRPAASGGGVRHPSGYATSQRVRFKLFTSTTPRSVGPRPPAPRQQSPKKKAHNPIFLEASGATWGLVGSSGFAEVAASCFLAG